MTSTMTLTTPQRVMRSVKTLFAGILGAIGAYLATVENMPWEWLNTAGEVLSGVSVFLIGLWARDDSRE